MPFVSRLGATTELISICRSKLKAPVSDRFIGNMDAAIEHHLFDISEAQRKGVVKPDAVGQDFARETMLLLIDVHSLSFSQATIQVQGC